jgi:hypothetical protein
VRNSPFHGHYRSTSHVDSGGRRETSGKRPLCGKDTSVFCLVHLSYGLRLAPSIIDLHVGFIFSSMHRCDPGSSVSIVSGFGLDDRAIEVRSPAEAKGCFL